jgi:hypothetical protein
MITAIQVSVFEALSDSACLNAGTLPVDSALAGVRNLSFHVLDDFDYGLCLHLF